MLQLLTAAALTGAIGTQPPEPAPAESGDASDRTVAIPLQTTGELPAADRATLDERFTAALSRSGFDVRLAPSDHGCAEPRCFQDLAVARNASTVAGAEVTLDGPDYRVRTYLISAQTGEVVVEAADVCEICGIVEVGEMLEGLAVRLRPKLETATAPTSIFVESDPSGAIVRMDGRVLGTTPLEAVVPPGEHEFEVSKEGYQPSLRAVELTEGINATYTYKLAKQTRIPAWLPWTTLGVGVAVTAAGIGLLVIHDDPIERDCNPDVEGNCQFLYNTLGGGIALTVTGAALTGTGIGLAIYRSKKAQVGASATLHNPGLRLTARF